MKKIISILLIFILFLYPENMVIAEEDGLYQDIVFVGTEEEQKEMLHLLFAKLSYDYLDDYEGMSVQEYVEANPELYNGEIWKNSGISYEALYSSVVGEWEIFKVYNYNDTSGFYAVAFKKGTEVVLSFRGSEMFTEEFALDESNDWLGTDFKFAILNELSEQFEDADKCYEDLIETIRTEGLECEITFTGHSLGGALVAYESIVAGCYGYSFDGAAGHVIDLVYYYCYLELENFTGIDNVKFCNYTDDTGYVLADLIQHNYAETMYQIDRETDVEDLNENDFMISSLDASSHIIWSYVGHKDNTVFLNSAIHGENTPTDALQYTYVPEQKVYMDIDENIISYSLDTFGFCLPWNNPLSMEFDYEYMLGSLVGANIDGRVVLGDSKGQNILGYKGIGVSGAFGVDIVMYGGLGNDTLYGYTADDVLISCGGNDVLDGNLGNDTYIVDESANSKVLIRDVAGEKTTIIFRNMNISDINQISYSHEDNILSCMEQEIKLEVSQSYENVTLYSYDGTLKELGTLSDLTGTDNEYIGSDYRYIVIYEGEGTVKLYSETGDEYSYSNIDDGSYEGIYYERNELGDIYICGDSGEENIMLILYDEYRVEVTNEDERVDMAVGKYSDEEGVFCCKRRYNRNFTDYMIDFSEKALDDGASGDINWSDIFNQDISLMDLFLQIFGIK